MCQQDPTLTQCPKTKEEGSHATEEKPRRRAAPAPGHAPPNGAVDSHPREHLAHDFNSCLKNKSRLTQNSGRCSPGGGRTTLREGHVGSRGT